MIALRLVLIVFWVVLAGYTAFVVANYGLGLLPILFRNIVALTWPDQFNLDFLCFLVLSALWTAWRNAF